jgi:hypothetical protein
VSVACCMILGKSPPSLRVIFLFCKIGLSTPSCVKLLWGLGIRQAKWVIAHGQYNRIKLQRLNRAQPACFQMRFQKGRISKRLYHLVQSLDSQGPHTKSLGRVGPTINWFHKGFTYCTVSRVEKRV